MGHAGFVLRFVNPQLFPYRVTADKSAARAALSDIGAKQTRIVNRSMCSVLTDWARRGRGARSIGSDAFGR